MDVDEPWAGQMMQAIAGMEDEEREGLTGSFAMIRLTDHAVVISLRQVAERGIMTRKLRAAALTDTLTELPNRRYAMKRLKQEWESARRTGRPLSVVMCDIDKFKSVNDTFGHDAGDRVVQTIAELMKNTSPKQSIAGRLGGEEFALFLTHTEVDSMEQVAEALRQAVENTSFKSADGDDFNVTVSVGAALTSEAETAEGLLKAADLRLYAAKHRGRNQVVTPNDPLVK